MKEFIESYWEVIIAVSALLVSVVSVYFNSKALKIQRIHNQKSVTPIPKILINDHSNYLCVFLKNVGVGPLIIEKMVVSNRVEGLSGNTLYEIMPKCPKNISWSRYLASYRPKRTTLSQNESMPLLEIFIDKQNQAEIDFQKEIREILKGTEIRLKYCDVYQYEEPSDYSTQLTYFSRDFSEVETSYKRFDLINENYY
ncbi:hypothetical protein [Roseivirga sp.]|uniref:hypothetical protein n=1 Tax=Roseivirga sp. TaxID=1964215 RepID=UPI003B520693